MMSIQLKSVLLLWLPYLVRLAAQAQPGTRFASHVSVSTPARSFVHGVGDPLPPVGGRSQTNSFIFRRPAVASSRTSQSQGYLRVRPTIPFDFEEAPRVMPSALWHNMDVNIPFLPPSPYKVDSPDPESLWPEGLFLPPINPHRFISHRRSDSDQEPEDPYLLEGSEAVAAVAKSKNHGELFFQDIPHIESLLANQQLRSRNHLKPHIIGSIRHTWPFNRN